MSRLTELWHSPYPINYRRWEAVWIPAVIIFLILYCLQPFGISQIEGKSKLGIAFGSSLISFVAAGFFNYVLPVCFPVYYKEQNWTLGKHVLSLVLLLLLITVGVWAYMSWQWQMWLGGKYFLLVLLWVFMLAVFPVVFFSMRNRNLLLARNLKEAVEMNACLSVKEEADRPAAASEEKELPAAWITFTGGTKEVLQVEADAFRYAEAEGNYVKVTYHSAKEGRTVQKMIRATMKQAEASVAGCPFIVRCHRAFLVNIRTVQKVDGNSQGYRLWLKGCKDEIPVSRAYAKEVKTMIESGL